MPNVLRSQYKISLGNKQNIQSVLVSNAYTLPQARTLLKKKGFSDRGHDATTNWYRFRQFNPSSSCKYYSKKNTDRTIYVMER